MDTAFRPSLILLLLALAACGRRPAAASPAPASTRSETVDIAMPIADAQRDPLMQAAHARAAAAGALVDTILVQPAEIRMRVGHTFPVDELRVVAQDATGATVADFAPMYVLASPVARFNGLSFEARAVGEAELFVEVLTPVRPSVRPRPRPSTHVRIVVTP